MIKKNQLEHYLGTPMTSDYVKMCVAQYFRYKRQCPIVSFERSVESYGNHNPDILVVNKKRRLVEIEVKVTLSDFKADAKKRIWEYRDKGHAPMPYQFYYAVPDSLWKDVLPILRPDCGLLSVDARTNFFSIATMARKPAPINRKSKPLSLRRATKMAFNQTGTLCSLMEVNYNLQGLLDEKHRLEKIYNDMSRESIDKVAHLWEDTNRPGLDMICDRLLELNTKLEASDVRENKV